MKPSQHRAFTLLEMLIVLVIIGILASVLVPQFMNAEEDGRFASTMDNLQALREGIELYRNQHVGQHPGVAGADPDTVFAQQLTQPTNAAGERSAATNQGFGDPKFPRGPYIPNVVPPNPFNGSRTVQTVYAFPGIPAGGGSSNAPGWIYEITSGRIRINYDGVASNGERYWDL